MYFCIDCFPDLLVWFNFFWTGKVIILLANNTCHYFLFFFFIVLYCFLSLLYCLGNQQYGKGVIVSMTHIVFSHLDRVCRLWWSIGSFGSLGWVCWWGNVVNASVHVSGEIHMCFEPFPHLVCLTIVLDESLGFYICLFVCSVCLFSTRLVAMAHLVCFITVLNEAMWSLS